MQNPQYNLLHLLTEEIYTHHCLWVKYSEVLDVEGG